jgi:hypothetical protein
MTENSLTKLMQGAVLYHEVFMSFIEAGFTREEALELVKVFVASSMIGGNGG